MLLRWQRHCACVTSVCWQKRSRRERFSWHGVDFHVSRKVIRFDLHTLADHSRKPERKRWGEPSLTERIKRVCGTRVEVKDNQLTLIG